MHSTVNTLPRRRSKCLVSRKNFDGEMNMRECKLKVRNHDKPINQESLKSIPGRWNYSSLSCNLVDWSNRKQSSTAVHRIDTVYEPDKSEQ